MSDTSGFQGDELQAAVDDVTDDAVGAANSVASSDNEPVDDSEIVFKDDEPIA